MYYHYINIQNVQLILLYAHILFYIIIRNRHIYPRLIIMNRSFARNVKIIYINILIYHK